jgi:hypothetical protein
MMSPPLLSQSVGPQIQHFYLVLASGGTEMYPPWQLSCFGQMLKFVNKLRHMPDTTLARMALCDAIADHRDYRQHNNWFAQLW